MPMFDEQEDKEQEPTEGKPTDWSGVIIGAFLLPVFFLFMHEGRENLGLNICVCLGGILLAIKVRWSLRSHLWFWGVIVLVAALNVPLVMMIHWPGGWVPAAALLPLALGEFVITVGAIRFAEKFLTKAPS